MNQHEPNIMLVNAATVGDLELVKHLIEQQGVDIHVYNDRALRFAAFNGHLETVKYLVEQSADVHADNDHALCWAALCGHLEIVKYLIEYDKDAYVSIGVINEITETAHWAAWNGQLEVVKYLIEQGADVHAILYSAFYYEKIEIVKYLIDQGDADLSVLMNLNMTLDDNINVLSAYEFLSVDDIVLAYIRAQSKQLNAG